MASSAAASNTKIPPTGVYVPTPTFFKAPSNDNATAELDLDTQTKHSLHLANNGITGLVLLGSTGEAIHLSRKERIHLVQSCRKALDDAGHKDYPIMAGVLTNSMEDAIEEVKALADGGADWALVLAPGYFGPVAEQAGLVRWFQGVADQCPIPILIYHYPSVTNQVKIEPATYDILAAHPNIVGCKMSHADVSHHMQVALSPKIDHSQFRLYSGFGQHLGPIVMFGGAAGVIDACAGIYPRTVARLQKLCEQRPITSESLAEAQKLQVAVSRAEELVVKHGIPGIKHAMRLMLKMGDENGARLPLTARLGEKEWEGVRKAQEGIQKIEQSLQ